MLLILIPAFLLYYTIHTGKKVATHYLEKYKNEKQTLEAFYYKNVKAGCRES
jgi:hypothetical protein